MKEITIEYESSEYFEIRIIVNIKWMWTFIRNSNNLENVHDKPNRSSSK